MQILIDTNVFIERESHWAVPEELQELENRLRTLGHDILVHKDSKQEIRNYENDAGRRRAESKIATYAEIRLPKYPTRHDADFRSVIDKAEEFNEKVDNALLYAVYTDQVDILITEDKGILGKAERLGIRDEVFSIEEGREHFTVDPPEVTGLPSIQRITLGELDVEDPIFDSLKEEYDFTKWFHDHPDRYAYVNWNPDDTLGAILILKPGEIENIGDNPELGKKERLKISTLKVAEDRRGSKTGELLISIAIREAINHEIDEMYLTHFIQDQDYLVDLISDYGFERQSALNNGEHVFVKRLIPGIGDDPGPRETHVRFYPSFYDGEQVDKFLVPVQPDYHDRLFQFSEQRRPKLQDFAGKFYSEGNSIKKAYLSQAQTRQIDTNDVLLFYRSKDFQCVTSIGVVEQVHYDVDDVTDVLQLIGRRSVFSEHEVRDRLSDSLNVLLFKWHFDLENPVKWQELMEQDLLKGAIRSIQSIEEPVYKYIRETGGIDERFTIN